MSLPWKVNGLPKTSSQPSSTKPTDSTTSVSSSQWPTEYPYHQGCRLSSALIALVHDHDELGRLHDLARLRMAVELHEAHRQAMRIGIVFLVVGHALCAQLAGPVPERQAARNVGADVEERGARRRVRIDGRLARLDTELVAAAVRYVLQRTRWARLPGRRRGRDGVQVDLPESREIRFPVRGARRWRREIRCAVGIARNVRRRMRGPLCARGTRDRCESEREQSRFQANDHC